MEMVFESPMGVLSTEAPPIDEPARRPVERIKKTLRKYTSKLQLRRPSAKSDEPTWDSIAPTDDASDPPRYSRLRMLDDYRWPVCEPLEVLVLSNDQATPNAMPPGSFRCQKITIPTRAASSSCPDDKETSLDRLITLPCGHVYHPACLQGELRRHAYARCPRCQHTLHYRLCHHRVHIPYFAPGTAIHPDELDGACRCCAPFPFMQHVMSERGEGARSGDRTHLGAFPSSTTSAKDKDHHDSSNSTNPNHNHNSGQQLPPSTSADISGFSTSKDEDAGAADFGWHWWALSVFEGGAERFLAERAALQRRLLRVCAGGHERERRVAVLILDTLWLVYAHLRAHKGLEWPHALRLVGPIAYEEAAASCCRTAEQRGVDVWAGLLDMMVERMHAFHLRGAALWQPYELLPFQPYYPMVEDLTDGAV